MGWPPCCWSSPRPRSRAGHEVRSLPSRERADRVPLRAYPASAAATSATEEAAVRLQPSGTYRRRRITFAPSWVPCRAWEGAFFFLSETASRNASATNDPPSGFCPGQDYTPHSTCDSWHVRLLKVPLDRHRRKSS